MTKKQLTKCVKCKSKEFFVIENTARHAELDKEGNLQTSNDILNSEINIILCQNCLTAYNISKFNNIIFNT